VDLRHFIRQVVIFTLIIETLGALVLWRHFALAGIAEPLWQAVFHSVSAFATAGFSLWNNSLEQFAHHPMINLVIAALCYLGALGFIVLQDAWLSARSVERRLTLTSKIILLMTAAVLVIGTPLFYLSEPSLQPLPFADGIIAACFQVMSASTTAGFNTIPIGALAPAPLFIILVAMLVGASPSGTGGGIKTTSVSALYAILASTLRGQREVRFWKHTVPATRLRSAVAGVTLYLSVLAIGLFALCLTEQQEFLKLLFEAASALGTVGLSMGITGELTSLGKLIVTALMFIGRVGPLTLGFSIAQAEQSTDKPVESDLAV
jgi:trk system potassium uptake protein